MNKFIGKMSKKNFFLHGLVLLLLLPLLFINIRNSHDWGCDYAQYIHQAKNIVTATPQAQTGYVFNTDNPILGPPAYPIGFPLLLSPVYAMFGLKIKAYLLEISIFLLLFGLLTFLFFNRHFGIITSLVWLILFMYNPWLLKFKGEVMSEIPFSFLLILLVLWYPRINQRASWLALMVFTILCGMLSCVRTIGFIMPVAMGVIVVWDLSKWIQKTKKWINIRRKVFLNLIIMIGSIVIYFILNHVLFRVPSAGFASYAGLFNINHAADIVKENLSYYFDVFRSFYNSENADWIFVVIFLQSFMLVFSILGMIIRLRKKPDFIDLITLLYFAVILTYPYKHGGMRFLVPVVPMLILYVVTSLKSMQNLHFVRNKVFVLITGVFILLVYQPDVEKIIKTQKYIVPGPQESQSEELWNYLNTNISSNAIIEFIKPRALALYSHCNGFHHNPHNTAAEIDNAFRKNNVDFVVFNKTPVDDKMPTEALNEYIHDNPDKFKIVWSNSGFYLYKFVK